MKLAVEKGDVDLARRALDAIEVARRERVPANVALLDVERRRRMR